MSSILLRLSKRDGMQGSESSLFLKADSRSQTSDEVRGDKKKEREAYMTYEERSFFAGNEVIR
ncbi:hypothetical protein KC929_03105 [Patescibacteria group bacterium]|nr:hypothetical protein [Patescibacteria group bacterium]